MNGQTNGGVFNPINLGLYTYTANNPVNLVDPDGEAFRAAIMAAKIIYKAGKVSGKLTPKKFKKILSDEGMDIADDIMTLIDGSLDLNDLGAAVDLVVGSDLSNRKTKAAMKSNKGMANPKVKSAAEQGRKEHKKFADRIEGKQGWKSEQTIKGPNGETLRPDALTPSGRPIELKPNTPTGRAQGAKQMKKYEEATGKKGRVIYYDPK